MVTRVTLTLFAAVVLITNLLLIGLPFSSVSAEPLLRTVTPEDCDTPGAASMLARCAPGGDANPQPAPRDEMYGYTGLANPAIGHFLVGTEEDALAAFNRRPVDKFIIPEGGLYLDPLHGDPHFGIDYASPEDYLNGAVTYVHPIGPGYVTARSTCIMCFVDGDKQGRVNWKWPIYNFGWGTLVVVETPLRPDVSIYVMYAHLALDFVSLGDYVTPEDVIGIVGTTGYSQTYHVHVEVRFGAPGLFWNADFSQWGTHDRWMATMFTNPGHLILQESHPAFLTTVDQWSALQPKVDPIP